MPAATDVLRYVLFPVVDQAKKTIASASGLEKSGESSLFGDAGLDSLGLVRFIVMVEDRIEDLTSIRLTLASERAMSRKTSPFKNLQTLADFIRECLDDELSAEANSVELNSAVENSTD
jgi:acyl carrier protein